MVKNSLKRENPDQERKIAVLLEDLSLLEDYVHDLFTFYPLPVCFVSLSGIILELNPAFEEISNFSSQEIIGEKISKIFGKKEGNEIIRKTVLEGPILGEEKTLFPNQKPPLIVQIFTKPREDEEGRVIGFFLGLFDVTKIKITEETLKKTQNKLLQFLEDLEIARKRAEEEKEKTFDIINNFADGILVFDEEKRLTLLNPKVEEFFRCRGQGLIGKTIWELSSSPYFSSLVDLLGREIREVSREELSFGENLVLEVISVALKSGNKKTGNLIILHDVTREKTVEKLKTEFVSLSAHQLRTPLSAIKWTLKMLLEGDLGEITPEQREYLEKIYQSNERMINLINDLLNVTRIEEGRYIFTLSPTDLEKIVENFLVFYKDEIKKKNLSVDFSKEKIPVLNLDQEKISLAIQNLLENAIKYTLPGGKIKIFLGQKEGNVFFSVQDSGIGIPESQKERIFTKFFRGANAIRIETEGSGLGLFITKNIIEAHGGKIWFESKEGKGSTFYFTLPIKP